MIPFDEKGFEASIEPVLRPWLREHVTGGTFSSFDDTRLQFYRAVNPSAKAAIVMVHGFCEFFGKFHETAYDFWKNGYTVYFLEQRGHGGSEGDSDDPGFVDVGSFSEYVEDLKCFLDQIVKPETENFLTRAAVSGAYSGMAGAAGSMRSGKLKLLLYAHSMGGCVGTLFLERYPDYFYAAVLSSPMLKMNLSNTPAWKVKLLIMLSRFPGFARKPLPGMQRIDPEHPDFDGSGAASRARFDYQFDLRIDPATDGIYTMNGGTYRWSRSAWYATAEVSKDFERIKIPVLVCQAGNDAYVDNEAQNEFVRRVKHAKLVQFPDAKHELYAGNEKTLEKYYREVLGFFDRAVTHH